MDVTRSFLEFLEQRLEEVRNEICEGLISKVSQGICNNTEMAMLEAEERDLEEAIDMMTSDSALETEYLIADEIGKPEEIK